MKTFTEKEKQAMSLGWTQEFVEGNGIDDDLWISPDKSAAFWEVPANFKEYKS